MNKSFFQKDKSAWLDVGVSFILALIFGLVFYTVNTPLGATIGSDNAMYLTMGTAVSKGYAPYTEVFDHKGPLLFILQAIPQLFHEGYSLNAVFALQVAFLFACLRVIAAMARTLGVRHTLVAQLAYLALIAANADGGNLTEEYSNLFNLAGLLVIVRVFGPCAKPRADKEYLRPAILLGAMTVLSMLVRMNNALPLCGMIAVLSAALIVKKRFAALSSCALGMLTGCAAALLPVALWLASYGALSEAIYGSIIHNMMYAETGTGVSRMQTLFYAPYGHRAILMAALSCLGALVLLVRMRRFALPLSMAAGAALGGFAAFISHKFYNHYLIIGVPVAVLGVCVMLSALEDALKVRAGLGRALTVCALLVCCVPLAVTGYGTNALRVNDLAHFADFEEDAKALYALVPEEERDDFMAYRVESRWYVCAKALPCMRFFFLQETLAQADPAVMDEIVAEFESDPPKWLVLFYNRPFHPPYDERVAEIFETQYEFVDSRGQYQLLRYRGNP